MKIDTSLYPSNLSNHVEKVFSIALEKIFLLDNSWNYSSGSPVFTIDGIYSTRGWTEWTQGFQFGAPLLAFEATNDKKTFNIGLRNIKQYMSKMVNDSSPLRTALRVASYEARRRRAEEGGGSVEARRRSKKKNFTLVNF